MKSIAFLIFILLNGQYSCQSAEQFIAKKVPEHFEVNTFERKPGIEFVQVVKYLPTKYSEKGNIDYTVYVQKALDENKNLEFPNFPISINSHGLRIRSFSTLYFPEKSKIILLADTKPIPYPNEVKNWYDIFKIYDVKNVTIYNPTIIGDRKNHYGNVGEWGAGIAIKNSSNISIYNAKISDTWGDGIFIGSENEGVCKDIYIKNSSVNFSRRNGVSVTSVVNLTVDSFLAANTYGTMPMSGFHIEPSLNSEEIKGIVITNLNTFNNNNSGFGINLNAFPTDDLKNRKYIDISLNNHKDYNSGFGFSYSIDVTRRKYNPQGKIIYKNSKIENPKFDAFWRTTGKKDILVRVDAVNVINTEKKFAKKVSNSNF